MPIACERGGTQAGGVAASWAVGDCQEWFIMHLQGQELKLSRYRLLGVVFRNQDWQSNRELQFSRGWALIQDNRLQADPQCPF